MWQVLEGLAGNVERVVAVYEDRLSAVSCATKEMTCWQIRSGSSLQCFSSRVARLPPQPFRSQHADATRIGCPGRGGDGAADGRERKAGRKAATGAGQGSQCPGCDRSRECLHTPPLLPSFSSSISDADPTVLIFRFLCLSLGHLFTHSLVSLPVRRRCVGSLLRAVLMLPLPSPPARRHRLTPSRNESARMCHLCSRRRGTHRSEREC